MSYPIESIINTKEQPTVVKYTLAIFRADFICRTCIPVPVPHMHTIHTNSIRPVCNPAGGNLLVTSLRGATHCNYHATEIKEILKN